MASFAEGVAVTIDGAVIAGATKAVCMSGGVTPGSPGDTAIIGVAAVTAGLATAEPTTGLSLAG